MQAERMAALSDEIMRHPESCFREHATARRVAEQLRETGLPCREGLAGTGVKGRRQGRSSGHTVAVVGELDSLLISDHRLGDPSNRCGPRVHNAMVASMLGAGLGLRLHELDRDVVLFAFAAEGVHSIWTGGSPAARPATWSSSWARLS